MNPTYDLERHFKEIYKRLKPLIQNSINSTYQFIKIKFELKPNYKIISFGITNLYQSLDIPKITEINNATNKAKYKWTPNNNTLISTNNVQNSYFQFNCNKIKDSQWVAPLQGSWLNGSFD